MHAETGAGVGIGPGVEEGCCSSSKCASSLQWCVVYSTSNKTYNNKSIREKGNRKGTNTCDSIMKDGLHDKSNGLLYYIVLYCIILYYIVLYCIILCYIMLCYIMLYYYTISYYVILYCIILYDIILLVSYSIYSIRDMTGTA